MPLNFGLAGKTYPAVEVKITAEQIAEYASASGDANPAHREGPDQVASAVFPVVPAFAEMGRVTTDPELNVENPLMIVHGEQRFVYHRPIRPGDVLTLVPSLEAVEDKGKGATFTTKVAATDADGQPVVDQYAVIFVRGAGSGEKPAETSSKTNEPPSRGDLIASFTSHVAEDMPSRYAPASGDHNPIHLDPAVAQMVGLPGVINHGLGTLSLVAGGLVGHLAAGDVGGLSELAVRFTDMVFPGSDLETKVWGTSEAGQYLFETNRPDGAVVMTGRVGVREA